MVVSSFLTIHYIMITLHQTLKIRYALNHFKPLICTFSLNNIIGRYIKKKKKITYTIYSSNYYFWENKLEEKYV